MPKRASLSYLGDANTRGTGLDSVTLGNGAQSTSKDNIAIGRDAQAGFVAPAGSALEADKPDTDLRAIAIGAGTRALEQDTIAIGFGALAEDRMTGAVALGANAKAYLLGGVAIGFNSVTDTAAVSTANVTINGNQYSFAGNSAYSQISIGNAMQKRQLTNMAAGQVNAWSTDGVNGSQLFATNSALGTLGGRVTINETNISKNTGDITNITNGTAGLVQQAKPGANITVAKGLDGAAIDIAGTKGPRKLIGLEAGVADTDAVNFGQLKTVDDKVATNTNANAKADNATDRLNALGSDALVWDESKKAFTARHADAKTKAVSGTNRITDLQAGAVSATSTDAVNGSQLNDTNDRVTDVENRVTGVENRVTTVEGDVKNIRTDITNITNVTDRAVTYDGKTGDPKTLITLQGPASSDGGETGGTKITNLQQGAVNATSTDAINGAQLNATNAKMQTLDENAVKYKLNPDGTKTNEVALQGADRNAPVLISNLEAGKGDNDAVNVMQLKDTVQEHCQDHQPIQRVSGPGEELYGQSYQWCSCEHAQPVQAIHGRKVRRTFLGYWVGAQ